jgi:hypothetical protein
MGISGLAAHDGYALRETAVNIASNPFHRIAMTWASWQDTWRRNPLIAVSAGVAALALLGAFHQVVHAGVDRAAARDALAHRLQAVTAACSVERKAEQRALCMLTMSPAPRDTHVAAAR